MLDVQEHFPTPLALLATAPEPRAPGALDTAGDALQTPQIPCEAIRGLVASQALGARLGLFVEWLVPHGLQELMAWRETALQAGLGGFPSPRAVAPVVARAGEGHAQKRARLPAFSRPLGVALGQPPARDQTGLAGLARSRALRPTLDDSLLEALCLGAVLNPHDPISAVAYQGRLLLPPWLHDPLPPQVEPVGQSEGAQHDAQTPSLGAPCFARRNHPVFQPPGVPPTPDHPPHAGGSDSVWHTAQEPSMVSTAEAMTPGRFVAPAHARAGDHCMACGPCMMRPLAWPATERARETILRSAGRQPISNARREDAGADARPPARAQRPLARLGDGGPPPRRWPGALGVPCTQRRGTPGPAILRHCVRRLALTPRRRGAWDVAEVLPQPWGINMMGQTGKATLGLLPRLGGSPCEACWHAWGVPLLA